MKKSEKGRTLRLDIANPETGLRYVEISERGIFRHVKNVYEDDRLTIETATFLNIAPATEYAKLAAEAEKVLQSDGDLATLKKALTGRDVKEIDRQLIEWLAAIIEKYRDDGGPASRQALAAQFLVVGDHVSRLPKEHREAAFFLSRAWHLFSTDTQGVADQIEAARVMAEGRLSGPAKKAYDKRRQMQLVSDTFRDHCERLQQPQAKVKASDAAKAIQDQINNLLANRGLKQITLPNLQKTIGKIKRAAE